jgi:hypothetical protein
MKSVPSSTPEQFASAVKVGDSIRMAPDEAIPILTDEVDVFWEFDDRDTRHDPTVKHLRPESPRSAPKGATPQASR